ncbi:paraneoplastic antigen Ma1 homolog [Hemitrygon akajei]|uniref:paraneoplastic antigen Ma1 homolog n=1 Tax=Hemitrygon akajei TaxID=2704970 RepID=UPI003BFA051E
MDSDKIELWCEIEDVPVNHACVLSGVDMRILDEVLIRCLSTVRAIGKVKVIGRKIGKMGDLGFVLAQVGADVSVVGLPPSIGDLSDMRPWGVHIVTAERFDVFDGTPEELPAAGGGDFRERVLSLLKDEGREWSDLENLISPPVPRKGEGSELASAINSLVNKAAGPRQKLRIFSGRTPTPEGEDDFETWIEHVSRLPGEWQCSEEEKRQTLVDSLRGVAAEVVKGGKGSNPLATWKEI